MTATVVLADRQHRYKLAPLWAVFRALTDDREKWIRLRPGEVLPGVVEAVPNTLVVWSSPWPVSPGDTIELDLTVERSDTVLRFRWISSSPPDERGIGITRQRLNTNFGGELRGWLASKQSVADGESPRRSSSTPARRQPPLFVRGVLDGVSRDSVLGLLGALPPEVTSDYDEEVSAVVVCFDGEIGIIRQVERRLSESGLLRCDPGSEEAVLRYLPMSASRPADWDVLGEDWVVCTTCNGWPVRPVSGPAELEAEMQRHTDRVHRGRTA